MPGNARGFTALAWAATQYKTTIKVNGTKLNVQRYVEGKGPMKDKAVLLNKDNKVVVRWKQRELKNGTMTVINISALYPTAMI